MLAWVAGRELQGGSMDQPSPAYGASVLVVDDDPLSARKLAMTVSALGHEVETARGGPQALERLRRGGIDVVLLDIVMPGMDGFEVLRQLGREGRLQDVPVIVVSALEEEVETVARALDLGAEDFLPKSYDLTILRARLGSTLTKKRYRDRELDYLRDVESLTRAAKVIEAGPFRPAELEIGHVAARDDALGRLAAVLGQLTEVIYEREQRSDMRARTLWGVIMLIVSGGLIGSAPALGRMAAELGGGAIEVSVATNLTGALACFAVAAWRGRLPKLSGRNLRFCLVVAVVFGCIYWVWLNVVAAQVEATTIALVSSSRSFMVFVLAALMSLERPSGRRVLGLGLGLAAVGTVLVAEGPVGTQAGFGWMLATLGLPAILAVHTLVMAWRPKDLDPYAATALMMILAAGLLVVVGLASGEPVFPSDASPRLAVVLVAFGLAVGAAVAVALEIVARAGAVFAGQLAYVQTLAGIGWGMILLGEQLPLLAWGALGMVILGFFLVQPRRAGEEFSVTIPIGHHIGAAPSEGVTGRRTA